jgi:hypothetical protein
MTIAQQIGRLQESVDQNQKVKQFAHLCRYVAMSNDFPSNAIGGVSYTGRCHGNP